MTAVEMLVRALAKKKMTCATAESCTGGGVGYAITSVPGASAVFRGGIVSYDNQVKRDILGVPETVLETQGAVSSECARAMADGARRLLGADFAVSLTGIAGPGGGSAGKPVGLVWFGLSCPGGVVAEQKVFLGDRDAVRASAIEHAIAMLLSAATD